MTVASVDDVIDLYAKRGDRRYGEGVTQGEHAVQCAMLAEAAGGSAELIVAALLHDIGHLLVEPIDFTIDDRHEAIGAEVLDAIFGGTIAGPVALHVAAKRYLCVVDPSYETALSRASRASLAIQGGAFDRQEALAFERLPYWREAVALRRFDDRGKREDSAPRTFADFIPLVREVAATHD